MDGCSTSATESEIIDKDRSRGDGSSIFAGTIATGFSTSVEGVSKRKPVEGVSATEMAGGLFSTAI
jgi:hypothetical protein